jgi:hypothetical protein
MTHTLLNNIVFCVLLFLGSLYTNASAQVNNNLDSVSINATADFSIDSIKPSALLQLDSVLNNYQIPTQTDELIQPLHRTTVPYWLFFIFLNLFALITLIRFRYAKEFNDVFSVFMSNSTMQQVYREALVSGIRPGYVLMNINFITLTALWIYLIVKDSALPWLDYRDYLIPALWITILLILVFRNISIHLAAYVTNKHKEIGFFHFTELQIFRAGGILLYPLVLLQCYAPPAIASVSSAAAFIIISTFFLYRYFRVYGVVSQTYGNNLFHFLIYICTLEIAPVLIGIKLILNNIH